MEIVNELIENILGITSEIIDNLKGLSTEQKKRFYNHYSDKTPEIKYFKDDFNDLLIVSGDDIRKIKFYLGFNFEDSVFEFSKKGIIAISLGSEKAAELLKIL